MTPALIAIALAVTAPQDSVLWQLSDCAYLNPAVKQWALPGSYSRGRVEWNGEKLNRAIDPRLGRGERTVALGVDTYLKYKTSTLWGDASYENGKQLDVSWNETSDTRLVWPYLTADSVGGDMNVERYAFSGGYADHNDRWSWGIAGGYKAGLYYRSVDPRPRNVASALDISAGATYRVVGDYDAGVVFAWQKYKQSNSVAFMSEMGSEKIYHLTGPATHYVRFAGTADNSSYNGHKTVAGLSLYPRSGKGFSVSADWQQFAFRKILISLNHLPLTKMSDNTYNVQVAWKRPGRDTDLGASFTTIIQRRKGTENVFGDPAGSVYPQIGSATKYAFNRYAMTGRFLWQYHPDTSLRLWVRPVVGVECNNETYTSPHRQNRVNWISAGFDARLSLPVGRNWRVWTQPTVIYTAPFACRQILDSTETTEPQLINIERNAYDVWSKHSVRFGADIGVVRGLGHRCALQAAAGYTHASYANSIHYNKLHASLSILF